MPNQWITFFKNVPQLKGESPQARMKRAAMLYRKAKGKGGRAGVRAGVPAGSKGGYYGPRPHQRTATLRKAIQKRDVPLTKEIEDMITQEAKDPRQKNLREVLLQFGIRPTIPRKPRSKSQALQAPPQPKTPSLKKQARMTPLPPMDDDETGLADALITPLPIPKIKLRGRGRPRTKKM